MDGIRSAGLAARRNGMMRVDGWRGTCGAPCLAAAGEERAGTARLWAAQAGVADVEAR